MGRPSRTEGQLHSHMTLSGTGGPRQPNTRFAPAYCAVWTLLGRSCSRARPDDQCGREYFYAGNAERRGRRSAALACAGLHSYARTDDLQNGLEINRRTGEIRGRRQTFSLH